MQILRQTVDAAAPKLRALSDPEVSHRPAPGKWSKKEILGHLIDSACNNHQRFVRAQLESELRSPAYEQEGWARVQQYVRRDWNALVELWTAYNHHLVHVIAHIDVVHLERPCWIGNNPPVSLRFLIEDYVVHMKHHLAQLER